MEITKIHPVIADLLKARGCVTQADIEEFLSPLPKRTYDPFCMKGMREAVDLVIRHIEEGRRICIYGDYDADGVTSVSLLYEFLLGLTHNVTYYIPSRFSEGYGLNMKAIDRISQDGVELIITVDCGSVSYEEVEHIKELQMQVIVTDHHNVDGRKPNCIMLNPKQEDDEYPFSFLCGCGVAFKMAQALQRSLGLPKGELHRLLDMVCIATIGDIVPLLDENRTLVKYGFDRIARGEREGLRSLIDGIGMQPKHLTSTNVAFGIVPHINAAGRMKDAALGVRLLTKDGAGEVPTLVESLKSLNSQRKAIQDKIFEAACAELESSSEHDLFLIYDAGNGHEGVMGIVAGKLKEKFNRPVIIVTDTEECGYVKGTGRCIEGIDLHGIMSQCTHLFVKFGGHAGACGFTMRREDIDELHTSLNDSVRKCLNENPSLFDNTIYCDAEISSSDVTLDFVSQITLMEPFGEGNSRPVFGIADVFVQSIVRMGNQGQYLKFRCEGKNGTIFDAVWFDVDEDKASKIAPGCTVELVGSLDVNRWGGRNSVQCILKDIRII